MHPHHNGARSTSKCLAIVARVSTEDQEEYGTSLDDQVAKGRLLAQLHDYSVDDRPYQEGGHIYAGDESGALRLAHRPLISHLLADARAHKFDAVCFTKIDRIARRLKYILEIWDALDEAGITVLVIDPAIDTSTPIGRLIRNVLGSMAEFERDTILERTMGGRRRKLASEDGLFLPKGKYGYTYTPKNPQTHTPGHVSINEQHAAVVTRIYQRKAQRVSEERIAVELTADGIPRPDGKLPWYGSTVSRILRDRAYMGTGKWGVTQAVRTERGTRVKRKRGDGRGVIEVSYPPIVPPDMWHAAQPDSEQGKTCVKRADADRYLLHTGMVQCAEHGRSMGGSHNGSGNTQYCCVRKLPTGRRTKHTVPARRLDQVVWDDVAAFLLEPARGIAASRALVAQAEEELGEVSRLRASNAARRAELDRQAAYLVRCARETAIAPRVLEGQLQEIDAEQERLCAADARLEAREALARQAAPQAEEIEATCREFASGATEATPQDRRGILEMLQVQVTMDGDDYEITGIVPQMARRGTLGVHAMHSSARSQSPA